MEAGHKKESFESQFSKLTRFWELLKLKGFEMMELEIIRRELNEGRIVPIVYDGMGGVRASYNQRRGLIVSYTNSFENPNNETRKEIESYWAEIQNS